MLTDKQEDFVQFLNEGLSQRKAYRKAYPRSRKWKDKTVDTRASKLFNTYEVNRRYWELQEQKAEDRRQKNLWSFEESVKGLMWILSQSQTDIKTKGIRNANSKAFIDAIKELNDLLGFGVERQAKIDLDRAKIEKIKAEMEHNTEDTQENKVAEVLRSLVNVNEETE